MPFGNPVVSGDGSLIYPSIHSPDYIAGVSGWTINRDGTAEFADITMRGEWSVEQANKYIRGGFPQSPISGAAVPGIYFNPNTLDPGITEPGYVLSDFVSGSSLLLQTPTEDGDFVQLLMQYDGLNARYYASLNKTLEVQEYVHQLAAQVASRDTDSTGIAPGSADTVLSIDFDVIAPAGAYFEISAEIHGVIFTTPVATPGNRATVGIDLNGSQIRGSRIIGENTNLTQQGKTVVARPFLSTGSYTADLRLTHESTSTAAFCRINGSAASPIVFSVKGM